MISRMIIFVFAIFGTTAFADPEDDAEWYMSHFLTESYWDTAYRNCLRHRARLYYEPLEERNISILDKERFDMLIPESAADEAFLRLRGQLANTIIEGYGPEHLNEIVNFFKTPLGDEMLAIAKGRDLFADKLIQSALDGPVRPWLNLLSTQQRLQFNSFGITPAGQAFISQTWAVRRILFYQKYYHHDHQKRAYLRWAAPPLDRPYIIEMIQAGGILRFPNPIARQSLLNELSASNP